MFCKTANVSVASSFTPLHKASEQIILTEFCIIKVVLFEEPAMG